MQNHDAPLTAAETGVMLGVSPKTVIRRAEAGELDFIRKLPGPNGDYLFDPAVVRQYVADSEAAGASA
jgi:hypothetical protein